MPATVADALVRMAQTIAAFGSRQDPTVNPWLFFFYWFFFFLLVVGFTFFYTDVLGVRSDSPFTGQADVYVRFESSSLKYGDGTAVTLYKPVFQIRNPYDNPGEVPADGVAPTSRLLQADVATSPRMGLPMFGLGLLEAIPEADILALASSTARPPAPAWRWASPWCP